jgi:hypothetical protein
LSFQAFWRHPCILEITCEAIVKNPEFMVTFVALTGCGKTPIGWCFGQDSDLARCHSERGEESAQARNALFLNQLHE